MQTGDHLTVKLLASDGTVVYANACITSIQEESILVHIAVEETAFLLARPMDMTLRVARVVRTCHGYQYHGPMAGAVFIRDADWNLSMQ